MSVSILTCKKCGTQWDGTIKPDCPNCISQTWGVSPNLITTKHAPGIEFQSTNGFRSVIPIEFSQDSLGYLRAGAEGTIYYAPKHRNYFYAANVIPHYSAAGSALPSRHTKPTDAMNCLIIAKPYSIDVHVYAEDEDRIYERAATGEYEYLPTCSAEGCDNVRRHENEYCLKHASKTKAE